MDAALQSLSDLSVLDPAGRSIPMPELWRDGPTVIAWVRHFG